MKKFEYSARTADGVVDRGQMEAESRTQVVQSLQDKGLIVVRVEEKVALFEALSEVNIGGVPIDEKVVFMRQLSTMISSGLPLTQALEILQVQARNPLFKRVLEKVLHEVEGGSSLAKAFSKHPGVFDNVILNLIRAGEDSGKLEEVCLRLADELEHQRDFQGRVKSAMIYPIIITLTIFVVVALVIVFMIPTMEGLYAEFGGDLPTITRILVALSNFVRTYWWLTIGVIAALVAGTKYYIDTPKGREVFDNVKLKFPILGVLNRKIQLAQFTQTLFLLVQSGVPILDALELTADSLSNVHFQNAVKSAKSAVEKGSSLALPLSREERFPLIVSQMVGVGEETGKLDEVLNKMAEYYNNEVKLMTDNLATIMEPLMLVVMGVVVGFIAVAVYVPMFSLANVIE